MADDTRKVAVTITATLFHERKTMLINTPKFPLGQVVATPGCLEALSKAEQTADVFLRRHNGGDWGELDEEDKEANELALRDGSRLLSAYHLNDGTKIWIITEADRSSSFLLLPEEY